MNAERLADITFEENGHIDVGQLNRLYQMVGWDSHDRRTEHQTSAMLCASRYYIAAHTRAAALAGFARVCGDSYVVQVLDVITHPSYRRRGIATACMRGVQAHIQRSRYLSVTLTSDSSMAAFYRRFDFHVANEVALRWRGS